MQVMKVDHPVNQIGIYILCIVICLPTVFAPYLSGSLLLDSNMFPLSATKRSVLPRFFFLSMPFPNTIMI